MHSVVLSLLFVNLFLFVWSKDVRPDNIKTCKEARQKALNGPKIGAFIPKCEEEDNFYLARQCWGSVGSCWCVHRETGEKVPHGSSGECTGCGENEYLTDVTKSDGAKRFNNCENSCEAPWRDQAPCTLMGFRGKVCQCKSGFYRESYTRCATFHECFPFDMTTMPD